MKHTILTTIILLLFSVNVFCQVDTSKYSRLDALGFQLQPVQPPIENFVFLYPGKLQRDTISACEFTYVKNRKLRYTTGQIVEVSQNWHTEPGGQGQVVERKVLEYYIISKDYLRYEIKNKVVGKLLMNSITVEPTNPLKCFKRKPQYVWDIKLQ